MKRRIFLGLTTLGASSLPLTLQADERAEARKKAIDRVTLRIERSGWGKARHDDLTAVLKSACSELAIHFDATTLAQLEPIRVKRGQSGPITHFRRTIRGEIVVQLTSRDTYWCQHAYQMAHEFGHVLCRFKKGDRSNLWFEESLCELASIYAIRQMATSWQTAPPYRNWRDYSKALDNYAGDLVEKYTLPSDVSLKSLYQGHIAALATTPTDRALNGRVAVKLLPRFESHPENWQAIHYLNVGRYDLKQSFKSYLGAWHRNCPASLKPFVVKLARDFGVIA